MKNLLEPLGSVRDTTWTKTVLTEQEKTLTTSPPYLKVGQTPAAILDSSLLALIVLLRETQIGQ